MRLAVTTIDDLDLSESNSFTFTANLPARIVDVKFRYEPKKTLIARPRNLSPKMTTMCRVVVEMNLDAPTVRRRVIVLPFDKWIDGGEDLGFVAVVEKEDGSLVALYDGPADVALPDAPQPMNDEIGAGS